MARLVKEREGYNWRMDDEAGLYLSGTGNLAEPPDCVTAFVIGHTFSAPETQQVELKRLEYLAAGIFDPEVKRGWTGAYLKFACYMYSPECGRPLAFILRQDGSGSHYYIVDDLDSERLFRQLCSSLSADTLWSLLATLVHTYEKGRKDEKTELYGLILQDRLKKRKRRGRGFYVEVLPAASHTTHPNSDVTIQAESHRPAA